MRKRILFTLGIIFISCLFMAGCSDERKAMKAKRKAMKATDFVVKVEEGRDPIVLQLTDTQIIDAGQQRFEGRIGETEDAYWATDQVEECCYDYLTETIEATNPDLILITGDIIYGEFDDNGSVMKSFVKFMDSFKIPWAPVLGNHEIESNMGVDWQCEQFEKSKYCLFEQRELTGNGNYTVGIEQGGELKRVFFMLDSNGSGAASKESLMNGHTTTIVGFAADQIQWYTETVKEITELSPDTKISFAFHIQPYAFVEAFSKYGYDFDMGEDISINIDTMEEKSEGDFGYLGSELVDAWDGTYSVWRSFKELGVDSIFVGHLHSNSGSVVYQGIRCQYGQKSSTYDSLNYMDSDGKIIRLVCSDLTPLVGGTVIPLSEQDGEIKDPYIYLCNVAD